MEREKDNLRILVAENIKDFGNKVNENLKLLRGSKYTYISEINLPRFSNSEGRGERLESLKGKDTFILSDINNYGCTYTSYGEIRKMSYDDHFQDIKRIISATINEVDRLWLVTPLLYQSRQHKRVPGQSLDCAMALKELEFHGVKGIITFDAHDPSVGASALAAKTSFDNLYPTNTMLNYFIDNEDIDFSKLVVINPDEGAVKRAKYFSKLLLAETGGFKKVRNTGIVENGSSPILSHRYEGSTSLKDKNIIVVDDMISSGGSMIDVLKAVKEQSPKNVYVFCTFPLFTDGKKSIDLFNESYEKGLFNKLYTTNLTYVPDSVKNSPWMIQVDCSLQLAQVINAESLNQPIEPYTNGSEQVIEKVLCKRKK